MAFHGLSFPNQNVSALDDGGFYKSFRGDGIIQGCEITFTNNSITIQAGWLIAGGRLIQIDGATTFTFEDMITTGYGRLMLQIDTSQTSTAEEFAQLSFPIDYSASIDGFTAPVQEDINLGGGTIYQMVLAIVQISSGNITAISSQVGGSILRSRARDGVGDLRLYGAQNGGYIFQFESGGIYMDASGYITVYGKENGIYMRPNGAFNTSGQSTLGTDGQWRGGHKLVNHYGSQAVSANVETEILTFTLTQGLWDITCFMDSNTSNNGIYNSVLRIPNEFTRVVRTSMYNGGGCCNNAKLSLNSTKTFIVRGYAPTACTLRATVEAIQIG